MDAVDRPRNHRGQSPTTPSAPATPPFGRVNPTRGVPAVVARIREDARVEPGRYLEECEVPAGGE